MIIIKHRLIAFVLCLVMLVAALVGCTTYDTNTVRATAYVYTPDGKLVVNGNCNGYRLFSEGFIVVTIDGIRYKTHISNVTIIETDG